MKTIISASRRTDIPAFYLDWFMGAIKKGSLEVANPFYPKNKRTIELSPDTVAWIVFWSRNFQPFLKHNNFFSDYNLFFHFTVLPQSKLEKLSVSLTKALRQMEQLCQLYAPDRVIWRYDPLIHWYENESVVSNHDPAQFKFLCKEISQLGIKRCYVSFVHHYGKFQKRFKVKFPDNRLYPLNLERQLTIIKEISTIANHYGITIYSCCNDALLEIPSVKKGHCIDGQLLNQLDPSQPVTRAKAPTRNDCGCTRSIDIGDYRTQPCCFGCIYCYANPVWQD